MFFVGHVFSFINSRHTDGLDA